MKRLLSLLCTMPPAQLAITVTVMIDISNKMTDLIISAS